MSGNYVRMRVTDLTNVCEAINCTENDTLSSFSKIKSKCWLGKWLSSSEVKKGKNMYFFKQC